MRTLTKTLLRKKSKELSVNADSVLSFFKQVIAENKEKNIVDFKQKTSIIKQIYKDRLGLADYFDVEPYIGHKSLVDALEKTKLDEIRLNVIDFKLFNIYIFTDVEFNKILGFIVTEQ